MKKVFLLSTMLILVFAVTDSYGQRKQKGYLKRKNKMISKYRVGSLHFDKNKHYTAGALSVGSLNYFGDLVPKTATTSTDISFTKPSIGLEWRYRFHQNMFFRGSFMWGRIKGDDFKSAEPYEREGDGGAFRYVRNLHFRNDIKELSATVSFDLFSNYGTFLNRQRFSPYVFAGVGVFHHNPRAMAPETDRDGNPLPEAGTWVALRPLGTEGQLDQTGTYDVKQYSNFQLSIPGGIGVRWLLDKRWDLEMEISYRYLLTDYIDDVSGNYVDLGVIDGALAKTMADRSMEQTAAINGEPRDFNAINSTANIISDVTNGINPGYLGVDGQVYLTYAGYGHDPSIRPNSVVPQMSEVLVAMTACSIFR